MTAKDLTILLVILLNFRQANCFDANTMGGIMVEGIGALAKYGINNKNLTLLDKLNKAEQARKDAIDKSFFDTVRKLSNLMDTENYDKSAAEALMQGAMNILKSTFGSYPKDYLRTMKHFGQLTSRLLQESKQPSDLRTSLEMTRNIKLEMKEIKNKLHGVDDQLQQFDSHYHVEEYYGSLLHSYNTFMAYPTERSRENLLRECDRGGATRIILGIKRFMEDENNGYMTYLIRKKYFTNKGFDEVSELMKSTLKNTIEMVSFCYGVVDESSDDPLANGVLNQFRDDETNLGKTIDNFQTVSKNKFWSDPEGVQKFICSEFEKSTVVDFAKVAADVTAALKTAYGNYGAQFAILLAKASDGDSEHAFVKQTESSLKTKRDDEFKIVTCERSDISIDVVIMKCDQCEIPKYSNAKIDVNDLYGKKFQEALVVHFVSGYYYGTHLDIGKVLSGAVSAYYRKKGAGEEECLGHFVIRQPVSSSGYGLTWDPNTGRRVYVKQFEASKHPLLKFITLMSIC